MILWSLCLGVIIGIVFALVFTWWALGFGEDEA